MIMNFKTYKRLFLLLLAAALVFSAVGCKQKEERNAAETGGSGDAADNAAVEEKGDWKKVKAVSYSPDGSMNCRYEYERDMYGNEIRSTMYTADGGSILTGTTRTATRSCTKDSTSTAASAAERNRNMMRTATGSKKRITMGTEMQSIGSFTGTMRTET